MNKVRWEAVQVVQRIKALMQARDQGSQEHQKHQKDQKRAVWKEIDLYKAWINYLINNIFNEKTNMLDINRLTIQIT